MKCLRCGYCCKYLWVMIINDPKKGVVEDNIIEHLGQGKACKHLVGDGPGMYSCAIHNEKWYPETPCFDHTQMERGNTNCRMGDYIMNQLGVSNAI